jgi:hypothetical protein
MLGDTYSNMMGSDSIGEFFSMAATSDLMKGTWYFIYSILSDYPPGITSPDISKETIDEFIQEVDPARLADIKVLSLGTPLEKPELPSNFQINTGILTQRYCLFSVGNNLFCQLFWLFRSNDGYNIFALGDYNGYSFDGVAKPVEPDGFKALIDPLSQNKPSADTIASSAGIMDKTTYLQKMKDMYSLSFSTPNDSINFFAEALAKRNIYDILRAFDIKEEAEYFDLYKATEWFKAFSPYGAYCMTNEYDFYRDINLALNCSKAAEGIISLLFSLSFDFDLEAQYTTLEYFSAIKNSFDTINSFSVIRNDVFASKDGRLHEILLEQAAAIGADNMEHRIIEYKFNGKKFTGAITLINYDGDWSIKELTSPLINLPAQLPIAPSDKLDYNSYI